MDLFVGRDQMIEDLLRLVEAEEEGRLEDVVGVHGAGKTVLLECLASLARDQGAEVFYVDMASFGLGAGFHNDYGAAASAAALWATLRTSRAVMQRVAQRGGRAFGEFRLVDRDEGRRFDEFIASNHVELGAKSTLEKTTVTSTVTVSTELVKDRLRRSQAALDDAFVEAWNAWVARRRVLVALDSFQAVAAEEIGHWMARLALRLDRAVFVTARTPSAERVGAKSERVTRHDLPPLGLEHVRTYFARRFGGHDVGQDIPEIVHGFTGGHAGGVKLAADLVSELGPGVRAGDLRHALRRLSDDPDERWAQMVDLIVAAVPEESLKAAVPAAAIVTAFDEPMLADLIAADDDARSAPSDAGSAVRALRELRLVSPVLDVRGVVTPWARLHEFLRVAVARKLRLERPRHWLRLHERAAAHYFSLVQAIEDGQGDGYESWYRYENPQWQAFQREWLYHSAQLPERRELIRARFLVVFLEAFYWWGCYEPFDFVRRLLDDWDRIMDSDGATAVDADRQFGEALGLLLTQYPVGWSKRDADWEGIYKRLLLVRSLAGLDAPLRDLPEDDRSSVRRAAALLDIVLAHTRRFGSPSNPAAERYYQRAQSALHDLGNGWLVAWVLFERADAAIERQDDAAAGQLLEQAAQAAHAETAASGDVDHELLADLARARSDLALLAGDRATALRATAEAVAEAYWFQGEHGPDAYTQRFYAEITTRAASWLVDADLADLAVLAAAIPGLVRMTPPVQRGDEPTSVPALARALFPRGPLDEELQTPDSPFMDELRMRREELADLQPS